MSFHRSPKMQPVIQRGSAAVGALLKADAGRKRLAEAEPTQREILAATLT